MWVAGEPHGADLEHSLACRGSNHQRPLNGQELKMDKDRVKGAIKKTEGRIQMATGDLTGNDSQKVKGQIKEAKGKVQETIGKAKDEVRKANRG